MKNIIWLIASILLVSNIETRAQNPQRRETLQEVAHRGATFRSMPNLDNLTHRWWDVATLNTVDTTNLEVVYNLKYRRHSSPDESHLWMYTKLQIGDLYSKYYSIITQFKDDVQQVVTSNSLKNAKMPGIGYNYPYTDEELNIKNNSGQDFVNSEIWIDHRSGMVKERAHDYAKTSVSIEYEEPLPQFEWELMEAVDTVAGYACSSAKTIFRGREWIVWFTMEIPIGAGPWKFNGLPGLILKAQDDKMDYIWECQSIAQARNPIIYYEVEKRVMTRERWQRYMRQVHNSPLAMLSEGGSTVFIHKGNTIIDSDNWVIPYNPIELE